MSFIDKGKHDNDFASRGIKALPPVTTDAARRVKSPTCSILKFGGGERQINRGCIEKGMSAFPPYALANILNHDGRYRLKVEPSDKASSSFHATKDGDEVIRSGPSALDLYYQDGLSSERTSRLEENVDTAEHTNSRTPNVYIPGNPTGNNTIATEDPLARTASAARPMLLPTIAPSDSYNRKVHGTATTNNNTRDRNVASRNQIASDRKPFSLVSNSTSAVSASQQSQALPKGRMGDTRMTRRAGRDVGPKNLEPRTSHPHRLDPFHVETKVAAAKPERVRRRWKSSEGSICPPPSQTQEAPKLEGCVKGPTAKKAQGRLQKDKSLDALKSEHSEALLILQGIDRLSTTTARKLKDDGQRGESVAIEGATERKCLQKHDDPTIGEISEVKAAGEGMAEPNAVGEEGLFASPPHITPRDEAAQRLMYRKWWLEIAKGENAFSSLEMSRKGSPDGGPTSFDGKAGRWSERANDGGGDGEKRQALAPKH